MIRLKLSLHPSTARPAVHESNPRYGNHLYKVKCDDSAGTVFQGVSFQWLPSKARAAKKQLTSFSARSSLPLYVEDIAYGLRLLLLCNEFKMAIN